MRRNREEKKFSKFLVYFIGFIMVGSIFGVYFWGGGGEASTSERGLNFVNKDNFWSTKINGQEAIFTYLPSGVEPIGVEDLVINRLKNAIEIDVTSDFNDTFAESIALAQFDMYGTLSNFNKFIRKGFTSEQEGFPIITCEDSTDFVPVIYFRSANATNVYLENNCIMAEALSANDFLVIKDRLVYGILGVIE